ncbi:Nn.00g067670.m01.CDS01 [Neocucurbitaria sp. VM-36]
MCLVSSKVRPAAQEALHNVAKLSVSCGCHPKVDPVVKLLRTLFDQPGLAFNVRTLRFRMVRKNTAELYKEQNFDLTSLRMRCLSKLQELGYRWWCSINNSVESVFAGLLRVLLPNLTHLDFWFKDHQRGPSSNRARSLTTLDLSTVSIGNVLRLNGSRNLQGTNNSQNQLVKSSIQFADRLQVKKAEILFGDLFDLLGCDRLLSPKILLIHDSYLSGVDTMKELDVGYFMDQLHGVQTTLETLAITFETTDHESEL